MLRRACWWMLFACNPQEPIWSLVHALAAPLPFQLPACGPGGRWRWCQGFGTLQLRGRPGQGFRLLSWVQLSSGPCRLLGNEAADGSSFCLSLLFSVTLTFRWRWCQGFGTLQLRGRPRQGFRLLGWVQLSSGPCRLLGAEAADGSSFCLSLLFSGTLTFRWRWCQSFGTLQLRGRPGQGFRLLSWVQLSSGPCRLLGAEAADGSSFCLSLLFSGTLTFQ